MANIDLFWITKLTTLKKSCIFLSNTNFYFKFTFYNEQYGLRFFAPKKEGRNILYERLKVLYVGLKWRETPTATDFLITFGPDQFLDLMKS